MNELEGDDDENEEDAANIAYTTTLPPAPRATAVGRGWDGYSNRS